MSFWGSIKHAASDVGHVATSVAKGAEHDFKTAMNDAKNVAEGVGKAVTHMSPSDLGHTALDVVGLVPGVGTVANLANAGWYAASGDYADAALSAVAAIPFGGDAADAAKLAKDGVKLAKDGAKAAKGVADAAKDGAKAVKGAKGVADAAKGVGDAAKDGVKAVFGAAKTVGKDLAGSARGVAKDVAGGAKKVAGGVKDIAKGTKDLKSVAKSVAENVKDGLKGVRDLATEVKDVAKGPKDLKSLAKGAAHIVMDESAGKGLAFAANSTIGVLNDVREHKFSKAGQDALGLLGPAGGAAEAVWKVASGDLPGGADTTLSSAKDLGAA